TRAGFLACVRHHAQPLAELKTEVALGIGVGFGARIGQANALDRDRLRWRRAIVEHHPAGQEDGPVETLVRHRVRVVRIVAGERTGGSATRSWSRRAWSGWSRSRRRGC